MARYDKWPSRLLLARQPGRPGRQTYDDNMSFDYAETSFKYKDKSFHYKDYY